MVALVRGGVSPSSRALSPPPRPVSLVIPVPGSAAASSWSRPGPPRPRDRGPRFVRKSPETVCVWRGMRESPFGTQRHATGGFGRLSDHLLSGIVPSTNAPNRERHNAVFDNESESQSPPASPFCGRYWPGTADARGPPQTPEEIRSRARRVSGLSPSYPFRATGVRSLVSINILNLHRDRGTDR